jgi:hypothetical protein
VFKMASSLGSTWITGFTLFLNYLMKTANTDF